MASTSRGRDGEHMGNVTALRPAASEPVAVGWGETRKAGHKAKTKRIGFPTAKNTHTLPHIGLDPLVFTSHIKKHLSKDYFDLTDAMLPNEKLIGDRRVYLTKHLLKQLLADAALKRDVANPRSFVDSFITDMLVNDMLGYKAPHLTMGTDRQGRKVEHFIHASFHRNPSLLLFRLDEERIAPLEIPNGSTKVNLETAPS